MRTLQAGGELFLFGSPDLRPLQLAHYDPYVLPQQNVEAGHFEAPFERTSHAFSIAMKKRGRGGKGGRGKALFGYVHRANAGRTAKF